MLISLPGYRVNEKIYENINTIVYRGYREQDGLPVVIKTLKAEYPGPREIARLQHEYRIAKDLDIPGIRKAYSLVDCNNGIALVSEDFGATSLSEFLSDRQLTIPQFLKIAIELAETLGALHQHNIIHKDIKPQNIILNPATGQIQITDFGISTRLSRENQSFGSPYVLEGTLAYISPEQTGRMNRLIDYRTDFYSLGITFYEMLAGQTPFVSNDPMELVHCHIAKVPPSPAQFNPDIPSALSAIILKLIAKTAEERYQSAQGLKADLEECLRQWEAQGRIADFPLAQYDIADRLEIAQKLYGRDDEAALLMEAFERIGSGQSELMLVFGYSGIGKSSLIHEVHKPLVQSRGYFISGKFDQFQRNIPYSSIIQAFRDLVQQLLTESEAQVQSWKTKLLSALGNNAQVIIDVIPAVELILGKQPPVPDLPAAEAQNRFNTVIQQFVRVFAQAEHPLVLFLDDLQWADSATLKLIQLLTTDLSSKHLLLIGAYRDNEVSPSHPLMLMLEDVEKTKAIINRICLAPLTRSDLNQLIADTLCCETSKSQPFAELVFSKTQGNPFFATEFLKFTYQEKLLHYNHEQRTWQWQLHQIRELNATDNVVDLMTRKVQKLQLDTQQVLKLAACIGNKFDLQTLSVVHQQSLTTTATELWEAVVAGLILPIGDGYKLVEAAERNGAEHLNISYKFLHDRVQQAVYCLIPAADKQVTHLSIGRLLLHNTPAEQQEEKLFDIVNQLNVGIEYLSDPHERQQLAQLDLKAGQKAKASAAYEPALSYLNTGMQLLGADSWVSDYKLTFALCLECAECAYLSGETDKAEQLSDIALEKAQAKLEKAKVYTFKIILYANLNRIVDVVNTAQQGLKLFDFDLPTDGAAIGAALGAELPQVQAYMGNRQISELIDLPEMTDPEKIALTNMLLAMLTPAYLSNQQLWALFILKMVNTALQYGNSNAIPLAYSGYGSILSSAFGNVLEGHEYGKLAIRVAEKFNDAQQKCKTYFLFGCFINHWREPLRNSPQYLIKGYQYGLEIGDFIYATYAVVQLMMRVVECGFLLDECYEEAQKYSEFSRKQKDPAAYLLYVVGCQRILELKGVSAAQAKLQLHDEDFDEQKLLEQFKALEEQASIQHYYVVTLRVRYLLEDYIAAQEIATESSQGIAKLFSQIAFTEYFFYHALTAAALYQGATETEQTELWQVLQDSQQKLRTWMEHCPENFLHKYLIITAEMANLTGDDQQAAENYDQAIQSAKDNQFTHLEALGNELAGKFYLSKGKDKIAKAYLQEARLGYLKWGAAAKVKLLDERYGSLLSITLTSERSSIEVNGTVVSVTTTSTDAKVLDLMTVIKASQALSGEIVLSSLLEKLMRIAMENAGAQKGIFLLNKDGEWVIEAEATLGHTAMTVLQSIPLEQSQALPASVVNYVRRTKEALVLHDASHEEKFGTDPYMVTTKPKSVLCLPVVHQGKLTGIFYLENNLTTGAFTIDRIELLKLLTAQVSISIENASLYTNLQSYSQELEVKNAALEKSEAQLREQAHQIEKAFHDLQNTQLQLIQSEKMSSLGQLVAGVAHEINNPVAFISANLFHASKYVQDLMDLVHLYQEEYPNPTPRIEDKAEDMDLEYLEEDLPKMLSSMQMGTDRIRQLSVSLRTFSRGGETTKTPVNIHEGIDSTLMILQHRLKANAERPAIQIVKEYSDLPLVACYAGQLNQVFMNILANGIDALEEYNQGRSYKEIETAPNIIRISTHLVEKDAEDNLGSTTEPSLPFPYVQVRILDNGPGMTEEVRQRLFDAMFTTKPAGKGTGLGLSISRQIVVEKHGGQLRCLSAPGAGANFVIELPLE